MHPNKKPAKLNGVVTRILKAFNAPESTIKRDWDVIESQMETALPSDYKELIDRLGGGYIDEYMYILEPDCRTQCYDLVDFTDEQTETNEKIFREEGKPSELQEKGSFLIPWATTDNGENMYWRGHPGQHPDDWTVVLHQLRDWDFEHQELNCTGFLYAALKNTIQSEIVSDEFSRARHIFTSFNRVPGQSSKHVGNSIRMKRRLRKRYVRNGVPRTRPRRVSTSRR